MLALIGDELRDVRLTGGLSQSQVGAIVGVSRQEISRIERGRSPHVAYETLVAVAKALGLDLPLRAFPNGDRVRDAGQLALLGRFRALLPADLRHRTEVPIGVPGDRRAWDEVIDGGEWSLPVEAETRLRDTQALRRRLALKLHDSTFDRMVLVVADTRHNRQVLRLAAADFAEAFPVRGRDAVAALRRGEPPAASAIVLV